MTQSLTSDAATSTAERGFSGGGSEFPHKGAIESSFGRSLSATAHTDDNAHEACDTLGAQAYAFGSGVAFNSASPDLHTAAHEAAHTIQQQGGVQLKGGTSTDAFEQHADQVADLVVAGKSSGHMFSPGSSPSGIQRKALQLKSEPDTTVRKQPGPRPQVDVNGLPTDPKHHKPLDAKHQAMFNATVEASTTVQELAVSFGDWLSSMTIAYGSAWNAHKTALGAAQQSAKDASALVLTVVLTFAGGYAGGMVADTLRGLKQGTPLIDGVKDLVKLVVKDGGKAAAAPEAPQAFAKMPTDPSMWSNAVALRVGSEVTRPALKAVKAWQHKLNEDPDGMDPNFDPVGAINEMLRVSVGGQPLSELEPVNQEAVGRAIEQGFMRDWIASELGKVASKYNDLDFKKGRDKLVQYGQQIGMQDIGQLIDATAKPFREARDKPAHDAMKGRWTD